MVIFKTNSIGVVAKDMMDYQRWVARQSKDSDRRFRPVINALQAKESFDEIVVTVMAKANPAYVDIYIALNGAYAKAKREPKIAV